MTDELWSRLKHEFENFRVERGGMDIKNGCDLRLWKEIKTAFTQMTQVGVNELLRNLNRSA